MSRAPSILLMILVLVVVAPAAIAAPAPENGRIAFARYDPLVGDTFTYTVNPDGSDLQPLLPTFTSGAPHWSPDGSRIAVTSGGQGCPPTCTPNTVVVNPDDGSYIVLPSQGLPAVGTNCSIWSPDGTRFACEGDNDSDPSVRGIYTVRSSDGGGLVRLTNSGLLHDVPIDYSPDGRRIVFGRSDGDQNGRTCSLWVVDVDGSGLQRITPPGFCDDDGGWSPDGREIAFEHRGSLFTVHPDGSGLAKIPLRVGSRAFAGDVSWSPDGKKIVFLLVDQTGPHAFEEGIATANADGTDVQLTTTSPTFDHETAWGIHPIPG